MSDRPLARRLLRPAFRLLRGARGAHFEETWPGLRLSRPEAGGAVLWRGRQIARLLPLQPFLDRLGPEVAILGSGPSVAEMEISSLTAPVVMLNGAVSLCSRLPHPLAMMVEDERFAWRHLEMMRGVPRSVPAFFSPAVLRVLAGQAPEVLERDLYLVDDLRKPFDGPRVTGPLPDTIAEGAAAFSTNPARGIVKCGTVAYSALQVLMAGPSERILLAGVDLTGGSQPRFYEKAGDTAWSGIDKGQDRILRHFALARRGAEAAHRHLVVVSSKSELIRIGYPQHPVQL